MQGYLQIFWGKQGFAGHKLKNKKRGSTCAFRNEWGREVNACENYNGGVFQKFRRYFTRRESGGYSDPAGFGAPWYCDYSSGSADGSSF